MGGPGPIVPVQLTIVAPIYDGAIFQPGQQLSGSVQGQPGNLTLVVGGVRVPLSPNIAVELRPGQTVQVQVSQTAQGLQLRINPNVPQSPGATVALPSGATPQGLSAGSSVQVQVLGTTGKAYIEAGGVRIPLDAGLPFKPGQTVNVELLRGGGFVRLTPAAPPPTVLIPPGSALSILPTGTQLAVSIASGGAQAFLVAGSERVPIPAETAALLQQRTDAQIIQTPNGPALSFTPSEEVRILAGAIATLSADRLNALLTIAPRVAQTNHVALSRLLTLFTSEFALGNDVQQLAGLINEAAKAGGLSQDEADKLLALLQRTLASGDTVDTERLDQTARSARSSLEARIAQSAASRDPLGKLIEQDLRSAIEQIRSNPAFRGSLQAGGLLDAFDRTADRILTHVTGSNLQNLHGLERAYVFFEAPFPVGSGIERAQIHIFGDGGNAREFDAEYASVLLDVRTARLGDLWVHLSAASGHCTCRFRTSSPEVAAAIEEHGAELKESLEHAGYRSATVEASTGGIDRLTQLASGLRQLAGLEVKA
jgi:hypothetical protein